ncbi:MAG: DUF2877 domain-containing protein [Hyphomonadaceae bacterium]|nr:DUF2877 domain-containing protein [Hyphomonadaceae bacterium]
MPEPGSPPFVIVEIGSIARRALIEGSQGRVCAVFERSFYVDLDRQLMCVGRPEIGSGPINALLESTGPHGQGFHAAAKGDHVRIQQGTLRINGGSFAGFARAVEFRVAPPHAWSVATLASGIEALDAMRAGLFPDDGLAVFCAADARHAPHSLVAAAALEPATTLAELTTAAASGLAMDVAATRLAPLLGLGPGLTPSGDDMLGGALVALSMLGLHDLRYAIWSAIAPLLATQTNAISAAHLAAAAQGQCSAALSRALEALMRGAAQELRLALPAVAAVGHTSGWDALAGALVVLRAFASAQGASLLPRPTGGTTAPAARSRTMAR